MFGAALAAIDEKVSSDLIARAFARWDQRYRENPDQFDSDVKRFQRGQTVEEYGTAARETFLGYLNEVAEEYRAEITKA